MAENIRLETIIEQTGGCAKYQLLSTVFIHTLKIIPCFTLLLLVFGNAVPQWWCVDTDNGNSLNMSFPATMTSGDVTSLLGNSSKTMLKSCTTESGRVCRHFYFSPELRTLATEFELVCDKQWVKSAVVSIQFVGLFIGHGLAGHLAEIIGRKKPALISMALLFVSNLVGAFSTSWEMFAITRFFAGMGCAFIFTVQYTLLSEFTMAKWRPFVVGVPTWPVEVCIFSLAAWLIRDWQFLLITAVVINGVLAPAVLFVRESFRWFVANNHSSDAERVIEFIARINGRPKPDPTVLQKLREIELQNLEQDGKQKHYSLIDVLRTGPLAKISALLSVNWFTLGFVHYGIQYGIEKWSGSLYLNIFLFGVVKIPTKFGTIFMSNRVGRRWTVISCMVVCVLSSLVAAIVQVVDMDIGLRGRLVNGFALVATVGLDSSWSHIQTMTIEMYPTVVRNIGYGSLTMVGRVGAIVGPQLVYLDTLQAGTTYFACAVSAFLTILTTLALKETKDADLQDKLRRQVVVPDNVNHGEGNTRL